MNYFSLLIVLFETLAICTSRNIRFHDCKSQFKVHSVDVEPCTGHPCHLNKGENHTIKITFTPDRVVESMESIIRGKPAGLHIFGPFPQELPKACDNSGLECPLQPGIRYTYHQTIEIKSFYPEGSALIMWILNDPSNDEEMIDDSDKSIREVCILGRGVIVP